MRVGAKLPNSGAQALDLGIPAMARLLEGAGFDSLWVSDHVVMPREIRSHYPFAEDGRATWPTNTPYIDALISLSLAAAVTERVRLGTAVLVMPQRNPVQLAKQAASIDVASGGRLELGVGAGWLAEEFAALGAPFEGRGSRLAEWIQIARECWTGTPAARESRHYSLPPGLYCLPVPDHDIPLLVGGHSAAALRRAGQLGDGWLAQQEAGGLDPAGLEEAVTAIGEAGGARPRVVLRIVGSLGRTAEVAASLADLARVGVDEVIVDASLDAAAAAREAALLRDAAPA